MFIHHDILYKSISSGFNCQHVFIMILFVIITMIDTFQIHRAQKRIQFFINQSDSDRLSKVNFRINDVSVKSFRIHKNLHPKNYLSNKMQFFKYRLQHFKHGFTNLLNKVWFTLVVLFLTFELRCELFMDRQTYL